MDLVEPTTRIDEKSSRGEDGDDEGGLGRGRGRWKVIGRVRGMVIVWRRYGG